MTQLRRWLNRNNLHVERLGGQEMAGLRVYTCVESYYSLWRHRPIVTRVWTEFEEAVPPRSSDRAAGR